MARNNGPQWYEQFLLVGRLDRALILLCLALHLPSASVFGLHGVLCIFNFLLHSFLYLLVS